VLKDNFYRILINTEDAHEYDVYLYSYERDTFISLSISHRAMPTRLVIAAGCTRRAGQ
jgi:hypothetical protein